MPRGGYQKPSKPAAVSGPGAASARTDGRPQPVREPDIDNPDLQYGDRQMLTQAQKIVRAGGGAPVGGPARRMTGQPPTRGKLPPWLTQTEDTAPSEPTTAGLPIGPGPGPEILDASQPADDAREIVLQYLVDTYGNSAAAEMLSALRAERSAQQQPQIPNAPLLGGGLDPASPEAPIPTPGAESAPQ